MKEKYHLQLTEIEKAYLAGFIDGEGSIGIQQDSHARYGRICLRISNTNEMIIRYIRDLIGFGAVVFIKRQKDKWQDAYSYQVASYQCKIVLEQLLPYLKVKRELGELALEFQSSVIMGGRRVLNPKDIIKRSMIRNKVLTLNKKGKKNKYHDKKS